MTRADPEEKWSDRGQWGGQVGVTVSPEERGGREGRSRRSGGNRRSVRRSAGRWETDRQSRFRRGPGNFPGRVGGEGRKPIRAILGSEENIFRAEAISGRIRVHVYYLGPRV